MQRLAEMTERLLLRVCSLAIADMSARFTIGFVLDSLKFEVMNEGYP